VGAFVSLAVPIQEDGDTLLQPLVVSCISVCLVHYMSPMADHWCKAASEAVARMRDLFAFVDAPHS